MSFSNFPAKSILQETEEIALSQKFKKKEKNNTVVNITIARCYEA